MGEIHLMYYSIQISINYLKITFNYLFYSLKYFIILGNMITILL